MLVDTTKLNEQCVQVSCLFLELLNYSINRENLKAIGVSGPQTIRLSCCSWAACCMRVWQETSSQVVAPLPQAAVSFPSVVYYEPAQSQATQQQGQEYCVGYNWMPRQLELYYRHCSPELHLPLVLSQRYVWYEICQQSCFQHLEMPCEVYVMLSTGWPFPEVLLKLFVNIRQFDLLGTRTVKRNFSIPRSQPLNFCCIHQPWKWTDTSVPLSDLSR